MSEIRIAFWRGTTFVDILEAFVVKAGEPVASTDEFRSWIERGIDSVLEEQAPR